MSKEIKVPEGFKVVDQEITPEKEQEAIWKGIKKLLEQNGIPHKNSHINGIITVTNILWDRGWQHSYLEVTHWILDKSQRKGLLQLGLTDFLQAMVTQSLGPIKRKKTPGRNEPCHCGSGKKFKACCIRLNQ